MAVVGVIAAAGHATRLQPLRGSKELLPIGGKPMMDYTVERMRAGGCTKLRVVTRPEKDDVVAHAEAIGAEVVLGYPATVSESFLAGMAGLASDDIVLIDFPDTLWEPVDGFRQPVAAVRDGAEMGLGLFRIDAADLTRSDVVVFAADGGIEGFAIKPAEPPSEWIWGCAAALAGTWSRLAQFEWPGEFFDVLCRERRDVRWFKLSDFWLDVGTPDALRRAQARRL